MLLFFFPAIFLFLLIKAIMFKNLPPVAIFTLSVDVKLIN